LEECLNGEAFAEMMNKGLHLAFIKVMGGWRCRLMASLSEYISVSAVTAADGFAITAI
jgi:hypothetical protein